MHRGRRAGDPEETRNTDRIFQFSKRFKNIFLFRKYFNESYYYLDESVGTATPAPSLVPDWDIESAVIPASNGEEDNAAEG